MNEKLVTFVSPSPAVLIDTWWNVNEFLSVIDKYFTVVLIDTWWNVNSERYFKRLDFTKF